MIMRQYSRHQSG